MPKSPDAYIANSHEIIVVFDLWCADIKQNGLFEKKNRVKRFYVFFWNLPKVTKNLRFHLYTHLLSRNTEISYRIFVLNARRNIIFFLLFYRRITRVHCNCLRTDADAWFAGFFFSTHIVHFLCVFIRIKYIIERNGIIHAVVESEWIKF